MTKQFSLGIVVVALIMIACAYVLAFLPNGAPPLAAWLMAIGTALVTVGVLALGAARTSRRVWHWLNGVLAFTFVVLTCAFCLALILPPVDPAAPQLWLGLPRAAALIVYGVGLLPLLVLPIAYALSFETTTPSEEELARLRTRLQQLQSSKTIEVELQAPR